MTTAPSAGPDQHQLVRVGLGPGRVAGAEGLDDTAVGFDEVDAAGSIAPTTQSFSVFPSVVHSTQRKRIGLVGRSAIGGPLIDVVDVAELGGNVATTMPAPNDEQLRGIASFAGEQASRATHVDDDVVGIDDHAANAAAASEAR